MDAVFFSLRRETVEKECVIFAMGIKESGNYEIPGFNMNPVENHIVYRNVLIDLHERGVEEPLLFIADGLPGIEEEIRQLYPRSDFQLCTVHASRNFESHVRVQDRNEIDSDLKGIFLSRSREDALISSMHSGTNGLRSIPGLFTIWRGVSLYTAEIL